MANANKATGEMMGFGDHNDQWEGGGIEGGGGEAEIKPLPLPAFTVGFDGCTVVVGGEERVQSSSPSSPPLPSSGQGKEKASVTSSSSLADEAIIICATEERAMVLAETAKRLNLPYARFSAIFAEGQVLFESEGHVSVDGLPLQPISCQIKGDNLSTKAAAVMTLFFTPHYPSY